MRNLPKIFLRNFENVGPCFSTYILFFLIDSGQHEGADFNVTYANL